MSPYQIILADDHVLLRRGFRRILEEKKDLKVIGEAGDGLELLDLLNLRKLNPRMIILDISMPNLNGIEATRKIKAIYPDIKILILTIHSDRDYLQQSLAAGAEGYLLKDDMDVELFQAIERIRKGEIYISPLLRNGPGKEDALVPPHPPEAGL